MDNPWSSSDQSDHPQPWSLVSPKEHLGHMPRMLSCHPHDIHPLLRVPHPHVFSNSTSNLTVHAHRRLFQGELSLLRNARVLFICRSSIYIYACHLLCMGHLCDAGNRRRLGFDPLRPVPWVLGLVAGCAGCLCGVTRGC